MLLPAVKGDLQSIIGAPTLASIIGGRPDIGERRSAVEVVRICGRGGTAHVSARRYGYVIGPPNIQASAYRTDVIDRQYIFGSDLLLDAEVPLIGIRPFQIRIGEPGRLGEG